MWSDDLFLCSCICYMSMNMMVIWYDKCVCFHTTCSCSITCQKWDIRKSFIFPTIHTENTDQLCLGLCFFIRRWTLRTNVCGVRSGEAGDIQMYDYKSREDCCLLTPIPAGCKHALTTFILSYLTACRQSHEMFKSSAELKKICITTVVRCCSSSARGHVDDRSAIATTCTY